jgi:uncharacterized protein YybS (DUF2232 family)
MIKLVKITKTIILKTNVLPNALVIVALVTHVLPILGLILCLFATIPGVVLWNKSIQSFG